MAEMKHTADHLSGIIERLEKAAGPDVDLDGEIFAAVYGVEASYVSPYQHERVWGYWKKDERGTMRCYPVPKLTSSIDAALTLVPEGWNWTLRSRDVLAANKPYALLGLPGLAETEGNGVTPAIALCIAALRSRSHKEEG